MDRDELRQMIADYMEKGFLENIIDMFRHDISLYDLMGELIRDERIRVRIGVTALMEELVRLDPENASQAVPALLPLLTDENPVVRGDAANLISLTGDPEGMEGIRTLLADPVPQVREVVRTLLETEDDGGSAESSWGAQKGKEEV